MSEQERLTGLAQQLAAKELRHQETSRADRDWVMFRGRTMAAKYPAMWSALKTSFDSFLENFNSRLPEPIASARDDGPFAYIITRRGRVDVIARIHLNSGTDSIDFTVKRRIGIEENQFDQGMFKCDLGSAGEIIILGVEKEAPLDIDAVVASIMPRVL
jgi:hypothetical protein